MTLSWSKIFRTSDLNTVGGIHLHAHKSTYMYTYIYVFFFPCQANKFSALTHPPPFRYTPTASLNYNQQPFWKAHFLPYRCQAFFQRHLPLFNVLDSVDSGIVPRELQITNNPIKIFALKSEARGAALSAFVDAESLTFLKQPGFFHCWLER